MADILCRTCSRDGCTEMVRSEQECHFHDVESHGGHVVLALAHGDGLIQDLTDAAKAGGWIWDGTEWWCSALCQRIVRDQRLDAMFEEAFRQSE